MSCCEEPDALSVSASHHAKSNAADGDKAELSSSTTHSVYLSDSHRSYGGTGDNVSNGNSKTSATQGSNSEKPQQRMFYPRIPPILSGSGDSKRSSQGRGGGAEISESKINALFDHYKDSNDDAILSEGIERFCHDLEVKPEEFKVLVLAWKFSAETMCKFTRHEFVSGCRSIKADSIKGLQSRFPDLLHEIQEDQEKFKDLYRFTFKFGLDAEVGQRILPSDMAIGLWKLVFSQREPPILERWLEFLEKHPTVRGIPRDTWNMFLNFSESIGDDLSAYDDTEAWPSLFDDFVECENDQTNQNIQQHSNKERKEESE